MEKQIDLVHQQHAAAAPLPEQHTKRICCRFMVVIRAARRERLRDGTTLCGNPASYRILYP